MCVYMYMYIYIYIYICGIVGGDVAEPGAKCLSF